MKKKLQLDSYRFLAAILVVAIHVYPLTTFGESIDFAFSRIICRIAVPIFLMITGYFVLPKALEDKKAIQTYTWKIVKIYGISILLYLPLCIYNHSFSLTNVVSFLKDIFFNGTFYHLWYFPALLLGIWITYSLLKLKNKPFAIMIVLVLYFLGLFGDSYYGFIKDGSVLHLFYTYVFQLFDYTRNGIFYVPVFLCIGYLVAQEKNSKIPSFSFAFVCLLLMLIEGITLYCFDLQRHSSMYFFLLPTSYFLFQAIIKNTKGKGSNKKLRDLSTGVYIWHPWFIAIYHFGAKLLPMANFLVENSIVHYVVVVVTTICFLLVVNQWKGIIKRKKL